LKRDFLVVIISALKFVQISSFIEITEASLTACPRYEPIELLNKLSLKHSYS